MAYEWERQTPTQDERLLAALAHVSGLFGAGPLVAIILLVVKGKESPFIKFQSIQAIAFELSIYLVGLVFGACWMCGIFSTMGLASAFDSSEMAALPIFFIWGFFFLIMIGSLIIRVVAAASTFQGKNFRYPLIADYVERYLSDRTPQVGPDADF